MSSTARAILLYLVVAIPIGVLIFLAASQYFSSWDGHAISYRPGRVDDPAVLQVLIVSNDDEKTEQWWPADLVRELQLPSNPVGIPPNTLPEDVPETGKEQFQLAFWVTPPGEKARSVTTVKPQALWMALLAIGLGFFLRNMYVAGSPLLLTRRQFGLPKTLATTQNANRSNISGKTPPPPGRRRGGGRRR